MSNQYNKYYQTKDLFGAPYPELIAYFSNIESKGRLLDLGCGQGRDAIPLARMGFDVTGIDSSVVGISQLNKTAKEEALNLIGKQGDIYSFDDFQVFDFILLDSIFHFGKKEFEKERQFLNRIFNESKIDTLVTICIQNMTKKVSALNEIACKTAKLKSVTNLFYAIHLLTKHQIIRR